MPTPRTPARLPLALMVALLAVLLGQPAAAAYCENAAEDARPLIEPPDGVARQQGRTQIAGLVRQALEASADVRGAEHARRAADLDRQQTEAGTRPQVALTGQAALGQAWASGSRLSNGLGGVLGLNASGRLYDGGRLEELIAYRQQLLLAADSGLEAVRERVAREAVLAALERNRQRLLYKAHQQHVAKLGCLASAVDQIVARDRGRASEALQARQVLRQAEVARDDALAALRQADARLQVWIGERARPWVALGAGLSDLPEPAPDGSGSADTADASDSPELRQLRRQVEAQARLARASAAERAPQLRWELGTSTRREPSPLDRQTQAWTAGLAFNYTLDDGGSVAAATRAAEERTEAARRALELARRQRRQQGAALAEAARSALQRAEGYAGILHDSDRLRQATHEQWARLGRRSLFDLISAETGHHQLRLAQVTAYHEGWSASAQLRSTGTGLLPWLAPVAVEADRP